MRRFLLLLTLLSSSAFSAAGGPVEAVHDLSWFVHVDLVQVGVGKDLAFYQQLIEGVHAEADLLLKGHQGPADAGCCVRLNPVSVATFGSPGDGLDVISNQSELDDVASFGAGSYLVQSINFCGGTTSTQILGCADSPGNVMIVALEAEDSGFLPTLIAHERGHNAGLGHVFSNPCELMSPSAGGGCLSVSECNSFIAGASAAGGSCECLDATVGGPVVAAGTLCADPTGCGLCSGGVCGECGGLAGARLVAAGGSGAASGAASDELIRQAGLTGDWGVSAGFGSGVSGLAYDSMAGVLYGVEQRVGDDALVTIDIASGAFLSTVDVLTGREEVVALTYEPGPGGGRLLAIEVDDDFFGFDCTAVGSMPPPPCFSELFEIDPSNGNQVTLGELNQAVVTGGVQTLAWDATRGELYAASAASLSRIDLASCNGNTCGSASINPTGRIPAALAWDPLTGWLLREGSDGSGRSRMDVIDPASGEILSTWGIDAFTVGALALVSVPEPSVGLGLVVGVLWLSRLRPRRQL